MTDQPEAASPAEPAREPSAEEIWEELRREEAGKSDDDAAPETVEEKTEDTTPDDASVDAADAGSDQEPDSEAGEDEDAGEGDEEADDPEADGLEDLQNKLADAEKRLADMDHRFRSETGRQTALQRRIAELEAQITKAEKAGQEKPPEPADDDLKAAREDYPDVVNPLLGRFEALSAEIAAMKQNDARRVELERQREQLKFEANAETLRRAHPDYVDFVRENAFPLSAWAKSQQDGGMTERVLQQNWRDLVDPTAVADVLTRFKQDFETVRPGAPKQTPLTAKRQQQKEAVAAPRRSSPPARTTKEIAADASPEEIWNDWKKRGY